MRRKLYLECLYLCALSLLSRVNNCLSDMDASTSPAAKTEIDREQSHMKVEDAPIQHCSIDSLARDSSPIRRKRYAQRDSTSGSKIDAIPENVGSQISERTWRRLEKKSAASNSRIAPDTVGVQTEMGSDTRSLLATDETDDPSSKKSEKRTRSSSKNGEAKNDGKNDSVDEESEESDETAAYSDEDPEAAGVESGNEESENSAEEGSDEASVNAEARNAKRDVSGTEEEYADAEEPNGSSIENSAMSDEVPVFEERYEEDNRSKRSNDEATKSSERRASETQNNVAKVANSQKRRSAPGRRDAKNVRRNTGTGLGESKDVDSAKENSESSVAAAAPKNEPEDGSNSDTKADSAPSASDSKPSGQDSETDDKAAKSSSEETKEEEHGESSSNDEETEAQYVKRVQDAIQRQIDAIRENVKREIEEEDRIAEIERNNAKYDELQAQYAEEDRIARDSASTPGAVAASGSASASASASPVKLSNEPRTRKRRQKYARRRSRKSRNADASQLRDIEGVADLDSEVYEKANLLHESIRKRAAPVYGAVDEVDPEIEGAEVKKVDVSEKTSSELRNERGLSSDEDTRSDETRRAKKSSGSFDKRHRTSEAVVPEGRASFLDDRVEIDEENDEGNEFDDGDGFADPASSFGSEKSALENNRRDFFTSEINRDRNKLVARHKRAGSGSGVRADVHRGRTLKRRQARKRSQQLQKIAFKKSHVDRDKRLANLSVHTKSDSVASLTGSSQELSPRLATEYQEAFGGLQTDSSGALARYKRIKRVVRET